MNHYAKSLKNNDVVKVKYPDNQHRTFKSF